MTPPQDVETKDGVSTEFVAVLVEAIREYKNLPDEQREFIDAQAASIAETCEAANLRIGASTLCAVLIGSVVGSSTARVALGKNPGAMPPVSVLFCIGALALKHSIFDDEGLDLTAD